MSATPESMREMARAIVAEHGQNAVTGNAAYHLTVLADVLSGTHRHWAGIQCSKCGTPITQHNNASVEIEEGIHGLVCQNCAGGES